MKTPSYFITPKWNYAPAARRKANRIHEMLSHAQDHLLITHDHVADPFGDDRALKDALNILRDAARATSQWEDEKHKEAASYV